MDTAERKRFLQGPTFSPGIRHGLQNTGAYERLLTEVRALNTSNMGAALSEAELTHWFEALLARPGTPVPSKPSSRTIFDDLAVYCRAQYLAESERRRQVALLRSAEDKRRRAEEAREQREQSAAERKSTGREHTPLRGQRRQNLAGPVGPRTAL